MSYTRDTASSHEILSDMNELTQALFSKLPEQSQAEIEWLIKKLSTGINCGGRWSAHNGVVKIYEEKRIGGNYESK